MSAELREPDAHDLVDGIREAAEAIGVRPVRELIRVLGAVGARFLDPGDALTREAVACLPDEAGLSAEMARTVVRGMARDWTADRLERLVAADFPDPEVLDGFRPGPEGQMLHATGGRLAFHIGAGNVPGVGATSIVRSLLVKCGVLLKPGRGDVALSRLFRKGLIETDEALSRAVGVEYWRGDRGGALEAVALTKAERVVAYGGNAAIARLRERIPPTTPLVAYHHRISMGAVAREALHPAETARALARDAATSVAIFDQRGCVSPHTIWVEEDGGVSPLGWAELLADALQALAPSLPPGPLDAATAAAIQRERGTVELRAAAGSRDGVFRGPDLGWTVIYETDPGAPPSPCGGRSVRVKPIESLDILPALVAPDARILQSLALAAPDARRLELAGSLARSGFTRMTTFRNQPWPPAWWRHDGQGPLLALVRWVALEG